MKNSARVAVVGATGLVGREILTVLEQRLFPLADLQLYASLNSAGEYIDCGELTRRVDPIDGARFEDADLVFVAAPETVTAEIVERAAAVSVVIDLTQLFADDLEVPLIVPEVNARDLASYAARGIIASPDAVAVTLAIALRPLGEAAGLRRVVATSFEPVSGAGRSGIEELQRQTLDLLSGRSTDETVFERRIAFNAFPQVGLLLEGGSTRGEQLTVNAVRRVLDQPQLPVSVTRTRVPLFYGQAIAVNVQTQQSVAATTVRELLREAPGILIAEELDSSGYPTPADAVSEDAVVIGRIRGDEEASTIDLWVTSDNLRKGSAVNVVQIAEILLRDYL